MKLLEKITRLKVSAEDRLLDFAFGISTAGIIRREELTTDSPFLANASAYQAAWYRNIRILTREGVKLGWRDCAFVDMGCGEGRACFYASKSKLYRKITGIDFAPHLIKSAENNLLSFNGKKDIEFIVGDAATYLLPNEKSIIFMFNPFDHVIMEKFLANNKRALENSIIAYANDQQSGTLASQGMRCLYKNLSWRLSIWSF